MGRVSEAAEALKELDLPARIDEVLEEPRFWTEACFRTFVGLCDQVIFEDPSRGLAMARFASQLADRVSKASRISKQTLRLRSYSALGSAYRAAGRLWDAEKVYHEALAISRHKSIHPHDVADLYCRLAILYTAQKRTKKSLEAASKAMDLYRKTKKSQDPERSLGTALLVRGVVHLNGSWLGLLRLSDAVSDFSEALTQCHPTRSPRTFLSATHNLAIAILEGAHRPEDLRKALKFVEQSQKLLRRFRVRRKSVADAKLRWVRGLILMRFGSTQRAEQLMVGARKDLIRLGSSLEVALISLDLGGLYLLEGRWGTLRMIAEEVLELRSQAYDHEALSALLLWQRAIHEQSLTAEIIAFARRKIQGLEYPSTVQAMSAAAL